MPCEHALHDDEKWRKQKAVREPVGLEPTKAAELTGIKTNRWGRNAIPAKRRQLGPFRSHPAWTLV